MVIPYLLIVFALASIQPVVAGVKMSKEQKELCKTLKKQLNVKEVVPFDRAPDAPYYLVKAKDGKFGACDRTGSYIIPTEYVGVVFFPAVDGDFVDVPVNDSNNTMRIPTNPTQAMMWGVKEKMDVFDINGNLKTSFPEGSGWYFGNYFFLYDSPLNNFVYEGNGGVGEYHNYATISLISLYRSQGFASGRLVRSDGTIVIPKVDHGMIVDKNPYVVYSHINDSGTDNYGMKVITDSPVNVAPNSQDYLFCDNKWVNLNDNIKFVAEIPAEYYELRCYEGVWNVKLRPTDMLGTPYVPEVSKAAIIRDPGEAFYASRKYDDVLAYYSDEGLDAPWASYYSAMALNDKSSISRMRFRSIVDSMEKGSGLPKNESGVISDVNTLRNMLTMSVSLFDRYIQSGDQEFMNSAQGHKSMVEYELEELDELTARYNKVRGHAAQVTSQAEMQQAQYMNALLGIFSKCLTSAFSGSSQSSSSGSSSVNTSTASFSKSASTSSSADNSDRKAFLKSQIADWKNKLKKAERSYEQAMSSGDDSWQKKRVLESKQNTIDECANMIRQYESELNSLK